MTIELFPEGGGCSPRNTQKHDETGKKRGESDMRCFDILFSYCFFACFLITVFSEYQTIGPTCETGFELPRSWLPRVCYGHQANRNSLVPMKISQLASGHRISTELSGKSKSMCKKVAQIKGLDEYYHQDTVSLIPTLNYVFDPLIALTFALF
jgi:hypothetical protein